MVGRLFDPEEGCYWRSLFLGLFFEVLEKLEIKILNLVFVNLKALFLQEVGLFRDLLALGLAAKTTQLSIGFDYPMTRDFWKIRVVSDCLAYRLVSLGVDCFCQSLVGGYFSTGDLLEQSVNLFAELAHSLIIAQAGKSCFSRFFCYNPG